ncbi:MAG TPA: MFS transporter [Pseudolabrys sp.]|nr:MFS transporter [Pseudolabrys sp.]
MSPPAPGTEKQLRRVILLMSLAAFASGFSLRISDPLLPQLAAGFGVSIGSASAIVTAYAIPYGLSQAFTGVFGDRFGKCQWVTMVCLASTGLVLLCALSQSITQLTLARLICAPGAASIVPLGIAFVGDTVPYERRQTVLARFLAGQMIGMIAGQVAGGIVGDHFGWRTTFYVLAGVFACAGGALLTQLRSNPWTAPIRGAHGAKGGFLADYRKLLFGAWPRFVVLAVFFEGAIFFGGFTYVAAFLHLHFDLSFTLIGLAVAGFGLGCVLYVVSVQRLVRLGDRGLVIAGGGVVMVGFLMLAIAPVWELAPFACAVLGFGYYMVHNTLQTHATQMLPEARGNAVAGFSSALYLGQSIGVALAAPVVDRAGAAPVFVGAAALWPLLAIWINWRLRRHVRR